ncbi:hypothetical protein MKX01_013213 [Papaver californicum]|nr:hypothetical protein MKX01_013213 [Papaver californicum]
MLSSVGTVNGIRNGDLWLWNPMLLRFFLLLILILLKKLFPDFASLKDQKQWKIFPKCNCKKFRITFGVAVIKSFFTWNRLRIQQRIRNTELGIVNDVQDSELPDFPSFIPFLPPLTSANLKVYYATCFSLIGGIMIFGGLLAPALELKLGIGGTSYEEFIRNMHLPLQLSEVDPIVASFSGGAVGVISALMVVEINNVKQQEHKRCKYCLGTGYLACARCISSGSLVLVDPIATLDGNDRPLSPPTTERCSNCSGTGKVMCPTCLCTGMAMASEHDPRIDPFD